MQDRYVQHSPVHSLYNYQHSSLSGFLFNQRFHLTTPSWSVIQFIRYYRPDLDRKLFEYQNKINFITTEVTKRPN